MSITVQYADNIETLPLGVGGTLTVGEIDDVHALTFVYPACEIALTKSRVKGVDFRSVDLTTLVHADATGVFRGLEPGTAYWAFVIEDGDERERYEEEQLRRAQQAAKDTASSGAAGGGARKEGCSCLEGNPCALKEVCLDWDNRIAVAAKVMSDKSKRK